MRMIRALRIAAVYLTGAALLLLLAETGWRMAAEFMVVYFEIAGRLEHACGGC